MRPNFGEMVLRWSPFRIVFDDPACQPRQPTSTDIVLTYDPIRKMFKKSSPLKLHGLLGPNFDRIVLTLPPFRIASDDPTHQPKQRTSTDIGPYGKNVLKISSENAWPIRIKLFWKVLWWSPFRIVSDDPTCQHANTA